MAGGAWAAAGLLQLLSGGRSPFPRPGKLEMAHPRLEPMPEVQPPAPAPCTTATTILCVSAVQLTVLCVMDIDEPSLEHGRLTIRSKPSGDTVLGPAQHHAVGTLVEPIQAALIWKHKVGGHNL